MAAQEPETRLEEKSAASQGSQEHKASDAKAKPAAPTLRQNFVLENKEGVYFFSAEMSLDRMRNAICEMQPRNVLYVDKNIKEKQVKELQKFGRVKNFIRVDFETLQDFSPIAYLDDFGDPIVSPFADPGLCNIFEGETGYNGKFLIVRDEATGLHMVSPRLSKQYLQYCKDKYPEDHFSFIDGRVSCKDIIKTIERLPKRWIGLGNLAGWTKENYLELARSLPVDKGIGIKFLPGFNPEIYVDFCGALDLRIGIDDDDLPAELAARRNEKRTGFETVHLPKPPARNAVRFWTRPQSKTPVPGAQQPRGENACCIIL